MKIEKPGVVKKENYFKYTGEPARLALGTVILTCLCVFLLVIATFTQISFTHFIIPVDVFSYISDGNNISEMRGHFFKYYRYIPQIPVILFTAALLGKLYGVIAVLVYICVGLFVFPVFALGGGPKYVLNYNFGYILAYIPAVFFAASILRNGFSFKNMLQASFVAVLTIHLIGVLYTMFIGALSQEANAMIFGWIVTQSGMKIAYDFFFSLLSIMLAEWTKRFLWITMC